MPSQLPRPGGPLVQMRAIRRLLRDPIPALDDLPGDCRRAGFARRRLDGWIPVIMEEADAAADRALATEDGRPVDL